MVQSKYPFSGFVDGFETLPLFTQLCRVFLETCRIRAARWDVKCVGLCLRSVFLMVDHHRSRYGSKQEKSV
jgi:hypothetical protein